MSSKKYMAVPVALTLSFMHALPADAQTSNPAENVFTNQIVSMENTLENVSDVISTSLDSIQVESSEPVEQPVEVTYVIEYVSQPLVTTYQEPIEAISTSQQYEDPVMLSEAHTAYDAALTAYDQALADYEAASQMIETTKEIEVQVIEEVEDEQGNITMQTRTEVQTITEMSYAGDVDSARANLESASAALEQAAIYLETVQTENLEQEAFEEVIVEEVETEEEIVLNSASGTFDSITWDLNDDGVLTISGTGVIEEDGPWPDTFTSLVIEEGITGIGNYAFYSAYDLTTVSIPSTVSFIDENAFANCKELSRVTLSSGLTNIGDSAFNGCQSLTDITIPETVKSIGPNAFSNCANLTAVILPDGIENIGEYAFAYCENLTSIVLPSSLTAIGNSAFYHCSNLETAELSASMATVSANLFSYCVGLKNITVPSGVNTIENRAFYNCQSLTSIELPDTVTAIREMAFYECTALTNANLGSNITELGNYAFYDCAALTELNIPDSVTRIGEYAFYGCEGLTSITLPQGLTTIEKMTFSGCSNLQSIDLSGIEQIGEHAFNGCNSITSITFDSSLASIADSAFKNMNHLSSILLPANADIQIASYAFYGNSLKDIYYEGTESEWNHFVAAAADSFPDGVRYHFLGDDPFYGDIKHSLALEGNIGLNFFFEFGSPVLSDEGAVVEFTLAGNSVSYLVKDAVKRIISGKTYYAFTQEVTSVQMIEQIEAKVILSDGLIAGNDSYSVKQYCDAQMAQSTDRKLVELMHDLLNYGGYSQTLFNYNTDDLANKDLEDTDVSDVTETMLEPYAQSTSGSEAGLTYNNSSLALESRTTINHTFALDNGYSADDFDFVLNSESLIPVKRGKKCTVSIPNIAANDLDTVYTVTAGDFEISYSALSYAYKALTSSAASPELKNLARALYKYNQAANSYFG